MKNTRGSVALITVMVVMSILILSVASSANIQINTALQGQNSIQDRRLYYVAESCLEEGIYRFEQDASFLGKSLNLAGTECTVSITTGAVNTFDVSVSNNIGYSQSFRGSVTITTVGSARNATLIEWGEI